MMKYLTRLERTYKSKAQGDIDVSSEIRMLFHDTRPCIQMMYLREHLLSSSITSWNPERLMLAGSMAGMVRGRSVTMERPCT